MITKTQAAGGGGLAAVGAGGTAVGTSLSGEDYDLSIVDVLNYDFTVLAWEQQNYINVSDVNQTVGNKYAWYLTGVYGIIYKDSKLGLDLKNNEKWWKWAFNRWKVDTYRDKKNTTGVFSSSNVEFAYSPGWKKNEENSKKALNRVCESIYEKKASEWTDEESLLRYCSPMGGIPVVIENSQSSYSASYYGWTKRETLVATGSLSVNRMFFYLKANEFFGKVDKEGIGKDLKDINNKFYKAYQKKPQIDRKEEIHDTCDDAYTEFFNDSNSGVTEDDLNKFCSWNISK